MPQATEITPLDQKQRKWAAWLVITKEGRKLKIRNLKNF
jgi:hypothetical protein